MKLQILMSTYNGERYLREQLESIFNQTLLQNGEWELSVLVRDDGSTDATCRILAEYAAQYPAFSYIEGENIGVVASFFWLLAHADREADYLALADQDDVWMADKLAAAVQQLAAVQTKEPLLYCSRCRLVDETLQPMEGVFFPVQTMRPSFGNALVENICTGCTTVFNQELARLATLEYSDKIQMHDWWLYLYASCFGRVIYDETPRVCYRQHRDNTVGVSQNYWQEFLLRLRRFWKNRHRISGQLAVFAQICQTHREPMSAENRELLSLLLSARKSMGARIRLLRDKRVYRQRRGDSFLLRLILLTGTL